MEFWLPLTNTNLTRIFRITISDSWIEKDSLKGVFTSLLRNVFADLWQDTEVLGTLLCPMDLLTTMALFTHVFTPKWPIVVSLMDIDAVCLQGVDSIYSEVSTTIFGFNCQKWEISCGCIWKCDGTQHTVQTQEVLGRSTYLMELGCFWI